MDHVNLLKQQYEMVRGSWEVVFGFIMTELPDQLHTTVASFSGKSLAYMLAHNANVYLHWLSNFSMQRGLPYMDNESEPSVDDLQAIYTNVDHIVNAFLHRYADNLNMPVTGTTASGSTVDRTPLELFTHVLTHEFHHKGQMLNMVRQLGHVPPDTDIIRS